METIKRMPICRILTQQQKIWLENNCCPICGLPKEEWKRRTDWTCCSVDCSNKYSKECFRVWQYWKVKAFERDKYTCVKCKEEKEQSQLIADHIIPIAIGGEEYDLKNVQTLCINCNKIKTKEDMKKIALYRNKDKEQRELK